MPFRQYATPIAVFAFLVLLAYAYWIAAADCQRRGGVLVKGITGPVCVAAP